MDRLQPEINAGELSAGDFGTARLTLPDLRPVPPMGSRERDATRLFVVPPTPTSDWNADIAATLRTVQSDIDLSQLQTGTDAPRFGAIDLDVDLSAPTVVGETVPVSNPLITGLNPIVGTPLASMVRLEREGGIATGALDDGQPGVAGSVLSTLAAGLPPDPRFFTGSTSPAWPSPTFTSMGPEYDAGIDLVRGTAVQLKYVNSETASRRHRMMLGAGSGVIIGRNPDDPNQYLVLSNDHVVDEHEVNRIILNPKFEVDEDSYNPVSATFPGGQPINSDNIELVAASRGSVRDVDTPMTDLGAVVVTVPDGSAPFQVAPLAAARPESRRTFVQGGFNGYIAPDQDIFPDFTSGQIVDANAREAHGGYSMRLQLENAAGYDQTIGPTLRRGQSGSGIFVIDPESRSRWVLGGVVGYSESALNLFPLRLEQHTYAIPADRVRSWINENLPAYRNWLAP